MQESMREGTYTGSARAFGLYYICIKSSAQPPRAATHVRVRQPCGYSEKYRGPEDPPPEGDATPQREAILQRLFTIRYPPVV